MGRGLIILWAVQETQNGKFQSLNISLWALNSKGGCSLAQGIPGPGLTYTAVLEYRQGSLRRPESIKPTKELTRSL